MVFHGNLWYAKTMKEGNLAVVLPMDLKKAVSNHCKEHGLKMKKFVEEALIEKLENTMDIASIAARENEETIPLSEVLKKL
jgi:hypothetical protein